ncbi:MAG: M3 family metallopeptidase [Dehalococcoidia bacterium]
MLDYSTPTPEAIARAQAEAIAAADQIVADVVAVPDAERTYNNTLLPLEDVSDLTVTAYGRYAFIRQVTTDADVRAAAQACEEALEKHGIELSFREDLYQAVKVFAATPEATALTGERGRLLEKMLRDYRRNGFDLPPEQRQRVKALKERLVELDIAFSRNIDSWDDAILVTREELAGLPPSYIERLQTVEENGDRRYRVSLDYPEFFPFMDNAESEALRRELQEKFFRKGGQQNVALLEEAIGVRDELARLLGYDSWAAYVLDERMAKTPEAVQQFLADLRAKVEPKLRLDIEGLTAEKRVHTGDPDAALQLWDWRFYHNRLRRTRYAVDEFEVARYFPLDATLTGMFSIYERLFGVHFVPLEDLPTWHPDVKAFAVHDAATEAVRAYFLMDLFPRPDKFGHAAAFSLVKGRLLADGTYQQPVSAIVANFTKPSEREPSLLKHDEVETLFHEFGHIVHQTLTRAETVRFSGTSVQRDFVEAPSQMLEHWCWLPDVLGGFTRHVESGAPLPDDLLQSMLAAKRLDSGVTTARQIFFSELDMAYHSGGVPDTTALVEQMHPITGFAAPVDTYFQAGFGHLFGYDAGYYGYLWSRVFADDMFTRFEEAGPLSEELGRAYRQVILEPGGADDGDVLVQRFLGREPNSDAFLKELGLE